MATVNAEFAHYCCDLLSSAGPCVAKRMFGGWGLSTAGLTLAILVDLGQGETLWLKADEASRPLFETAGCARFSYAAKGVPRSMNYYSAPPEAMESPALMAPWARLALQAALAARKPPVKRAKPPRSR
jgi:DNA transformation protein